MYGFGSSRFSMARGVVLLVAFLVAMIVKFRWFELCGVLVGAMLIVAATKSRRDRPSR